MTLTIPFCFQKFQKFHPTTYQNIAIVQLLCTIIFIFYMKHNSLLCFFISLLEMIILLLLHFLYYSVKWKVMDEEDYVSKRNILLLSFFLNLFVSCWTYILFFLIFQSFSTVLMALKITVNIIFIKKWGNAYLCYINGSREFFPSHFDIWDERNDQKKME
jgi:hypothetical protein